jgi:hypothetical protein
VDVDGTILQATSAVVVLAAHAGRRADRVRWENRTACDEPAGHVGVL